MTEAYLGEIRIMSFNFAPQGWAFCNGQTLPINQNQGLFSLLGTNYGGNGQTTFALPNLQGRTPIHQGNGHTVGEAAGSTAVTINIQQMPQHTHSMAAGTDTNTRSGNPGNKFPTDTSPSSQYNPASAINVAFNSQTITAVGGSQPHNNMQPYLALNFCIALSGVFPSQN